MGTAVAGGILQGAGDTQQAIAAAMQVGAQRKAAKAASKVTQAAKDYNRDFAADNLERQTGYQEPYRSAGGRALGDLEDFRMREADPYQASEFGGVNMDEDPGVQYRMDQGRNFLDSSAGSQGSLFSGAQQKALMEHGQNLGSQEFNNAYGRQYGQFKDTEDANRNQYNTEADRTMNYDKFRMGQLEGMANMGQAATNQLSAADANISKQQLANEMMLSGYSADQQGVIAGGPLATSSALNMTLGKGASSYGKQLSGMGSVGGGGGSSASAADQAGYGTK